MTELGQLLDIASKITIISGLLVIIYGGITRRWVFGWLYTQTLDDCERQLLDKDARIAALEKDRDEWKDHTLRLLDTQQHMAGSLDKLVSAQAQGQGQVKP
jgi:hypothetical protein